MTVVGIVHFNILRFCFKDLAKGVSPKFKWRLQLRNSIPPTMPVGKDIRVHLMDRNCWRNIGTEVKPAERCTAKGKRISNPRGMGHIPPFTYVSRRILGNLISYSRLEEASGLFSTQHRSCH
ncbi:hypothetical protein TNCV_1447611 [Trichonephila clavipes]|nr:hypothetical protein TNCV_1447611 [Trichonephila clavipes]